MLFHSSANTTWNNLPLSGLFVEMLQRLVALSRGVDDLRALGPRRWTHGSVPLGAAPAGPGVSVPDVSGLPARTAVRRLHALGWRHKIALPEGLASTYRSSVVASGRLPVGLDRRPHHAQRLLCRLVPHHQQASACERDMHE